MKMTIYEGTPEEIAKFSELTGIRNGPSGNNVEKFAEKAWQKNANSDQSKRSDKHYVTTDFAKLAITRRPLSSPMKRVLRYLYDSSPEWVSSSTLYEISGYTSSQFAGLMGAFGRRMAHTKDYDADAHFFDYEWNDAEGAWKYRLPSSVLEALEQIDITD